MIRDIDSFFPQWFENNPVRLVDIGASGGIKDDWRLLPNLHVIGFEPDPDAYEALQQEPDDAFTCINTAILDKQGTSPFNICRKRLLSSVYRPNYAFLQLFPDAARWDVIQTEEVKVDTLDHALESAGVQDVDAIKIDVQGCAGLILKQAKQTLRSTLVMEIEIEFQPLYEGQDLFPDIDKLAREAGFSLFDLRPWHWKRAQGIAYGMPKGQLIFADVLYLRNFDHDQHDAFDATPEKIRKAIKLSLHFGYVDYALQIFSKYAHFFSSEEQQQFQRFLDTTYVWRSDARNVLGNLEYLKDT